MFHGVPFAVWESPGDSRDQVQSMTGDTTFQPNCLPYLNNKLALEQQVAMRFHVSKALDTAPILFCPQAANLSLVDSHSLP